MSGATVGRASPGPFSRVRAAGPNAALGAIAGLITVYLGFAAGGYFPGSTSLATVGVAVVLVLRIGLAAHPFEGIRARAAMPIAALALLAVWILSSGAWSHAFGRALLEFDRALLYLGILVLFASFGHRPGRSAALAGGFALGIVVVCTAGLATRLLPAVFPNGLAVQSARLSYPVTYWNALGLLAVVGIIICLSLSATDHLPRIARSLWAAAVPALATTLLLTFSRGSLAVGALALVVLCALLRTRALALTLLACGPPAAAAGVAAYSAPALAMQRLSGSDAVSQGHRVAIAVALSTLAAFALRAALCRWDRRASPRRSPGPRARGVATLLGALVAVGAVIGVGAAIDLPGQFSRQYHHFVIGNDVSAGPPRERLLNAGNNGRLMIWRVALDAWRPHVIRGQGAGTFQVLWERGRRETMDVVNAHSLYLGALAELGIIGLGLLLVCLLPLLAGLVTRFTSSSRTIDAGLLAAAVAWTVHTGIDWDWEMPVVTWWVFAVGGLALARGPENAVALSPPGRRGRLLGMAVVAVVAVAPVQVGLSQVNLTKAISALKGNDCESAVGHALSSMSEVGARAEPYEIVAYCDARYGFGALARAMIQNAINRDPQNWEFRYDLAIVRGYEGLDPRAAVVQARNLNPLSPLTISLARGLSGPDPRAWRAGAAKAPLLLPAG